MRPVSVQVPSGRPTIAEQSKLPNVGTLDVPVYMPWELRELGDMFWKVVVPHSVLGSSDKVLDRIGNLREGS